MLLVHPVGTSVSSVKCNKPVHSASHYWQWGHFFLAFGETISVENPTTDPCVNGTGVNTCETSKLQYRLSV